MATDVHPKPGELKPYVAVGPTEDLSFTVRKEAFDSSVMVAAIFFVLGFMIVVVLLVFFALEQAKLPPPPPPLNPNANPDPNHANIGSSASPTAVLLKKASLGPDASSFTNKQTCVTAPHGVWADDRCMCQPPFFGPTCSQEKHDSKFFAVGIPDEGNLHMDIINEEFATGKSFNESSCSARCDNTFGCIGFIYHRHSDTDGMCAILENSVTVPDGTTIPYDPHSEATLYLRSSANLHFQNKIFLGTVTSAIPPRFWLAQDTPSFMTLKLNEIRQLKFAPTAVKMSGSYIGIYCRHAFTAEDIDILLERGTTSSCYIHNPGTQLEVPSEWKYRLQDHTLSSLYVLYV